MSVAVLGASAIVARFDLVTDLPLSDEWIYRWPLQRVLEGHGVQLWPGVQPLAAVQLAAAFPLAAAGAAPRLWRLSVLPFLVLFVFFSWRSARTLGAGRGRSAFAAVVVALSPLFLQVTTGLMSDIAYLALLMGAAWTGQLWLTGRGRAILPAAFILLATLERTHGVGIALALVMATVIGPRPASPRSTWPGLALCLLAAAVGAAAPYVLGLATPAMARPLAAGVLSHTFANLVGTVVEAPIMASFLLLPLAPLVVARPVDEMRGAGRAALVPAGWACVAVVAALVFQFGFGTMIFPGDVFGNWGLGQLHLGGAKTSPWPLPAFYLLEVVVLAVAAVLLFHRRGLWRPSRLGTQGVFLALLAISQLLPMLSTSATDRYHLAVAAPLAPLLAGSAAGSGLGRDTLRRSAAAVLVALGLAAFVIGEQDYLAWQVARDDAARQVYALGTPPAQVDAGYEAMAKYVALPAVRRTGRLPSELDPSNLAPRHPLLRLQFAPSSAPGPGTSYGGPSPGRVVRLPAR